MKYFLIIILSFTFIISCDKKEEIKLIDNFIENPEKIMKYISDTSNTTSYFKSRNKDLKKFFSLTLEHINKYFKDGYDMDIHEYFKDSNGNNSHGVIVHLLSSISDKKIIICLVNIDNKWKIARFDLYDMLDYI